MRREVGIRLAAIVATWGVVAVSGASVGSGQAVVELRIPAFTAYSEPEKDAVEFSEGQGATGWRDKREQIVWYGKLNATGELRPNLTLRLPKGETARLRLTVAGQSRMADVQAGSDDTQLLSMDFGKYRISKPGYYRFALSGLMKSGTTFGNPDALILRGPAVVGAHFNLKERRNAASVHLGYPTPRNAPIQWFYNEVTAKTDPVASYYMACGFQRGYFGMQVNSPTERRIIFSVWDSGTEAVDRGKVGEENRVRLLAKGAGVVASDFGNEGTGGHSHLVYRWKTGATYRFLVSAQPDGNDTVYSGWFWFPERRKWALIARFLAPKDGGWLRGLYSFNENFDGANGQKQRLAWFGPAWIKTEDGHWLELTTARFTHDATGKADRFDYGMGLVENRFYLSNGRFHEDEAESAPIHYGDQRTRPASNNPPSNRDLPILPLPPHFHAAEMENKNAPGNTPANSSGR